MMDDVKVGRRERCWEILKEVMLGVEQVVDLAYSLADMKAV